MTTEKLKDIDLEAYEPNQRRVALDHLRLAEDAMDRAEDADLLDHVLRIGLAGLADMYEQYVEEREADE